MSHALNRLRWMLKDQLFVRTPEGMMPTPRAEFLAEPICRALFEPRRGSSSEDFVAEEADRRFTIAANNYAAAVLAGPIFAECRAVAPKVRLQLRPSGTLDVPELLDRGEFDVALVGQQAPVSRFSSQMLMEDEYVARHAARPPEGSAATSSWKHLLRCRTSSSRPAATIWASWTPNSRRAD